MALEKQLIQIDFGQGFDTKTDPKQLPPGKLADLVNMRIDKSKAITKRVGTELVATAGSDLLSAWTQGRDVIANTKSASYRLANGGLVSAGVSQLVNAVGIQRVAKGSSNYYSPDHAALTNAAGSRIHSVVYLRNSIAYQMILDEDGRTLVNETALSSSATAYAVRTIAYPGVGSTSDRRLYTAVWRGGTSIDVSYYDVAAGTFAGVTSLTTPDATTTIPNSWDWAVDDVNHAIYVAFYTSAGAQVKLSKITTSTMAVSSTTFVVVDAYRIAVAFDTSTSRVFVIWDDVGAGGVWATVYSTALAVVTAPTSVYVGQAAWCIGACTNNAGTTRVCIGHGLADWAGGAKTVKTATVDLTQTLAGVPTAGNTLGCIPISKPWYDPSIGEFSVVLGYGRHRETYLCWASSGNDPANARNQTPRAKFLTDEAADVNHIETSSTVVTHENLLCRNVSYEDAAQTKWVVACGSIARATASGTEIAVTTRGVVLATLDPVCSPNVAEVNGSGFVSGGMLAAHDGRAFCESGIFPSPARLRFLPQAGGTLPINQTFLYICVWEWHDAHGNICRSAPSEINSVATGANTRVLISVGATGLSRRLLGQAPALVAYRTVNGGTGRFYRTTLSTDPFVPAINSATDNAYDSTSDTDLANAEIYPFTGGVLPPWVPNGPRCVAVAGDRLFIDDPAEEGCVRYSDKFLNGEGPSFHEDNRQRIPAEGGEVLAIAGLDDKKVVFKRRASFWFSGDGPNELGGGGGFSETLIASPTVGCDSQRAVAEIPQGLLFFAAGIGFSLLTRAMQVVPLAEADDYKDGNVLDMLVVPETNELRVSMDGLFLADGTTACTLVYNWAENAWSQFTDSAYQYAPLQMFVGDDDAVHMLLYSVGARELYRENPDAYTDAHHDNAAYRPLFSTGWLTPGQLGYWRVYRLLLLGKQIDAATQQLSVAIQYDYSDATSETRTITTANAKIGSSAYNFEVQPSRQKCQAIKFTIFETVAVSNSLEFTAMALEVGVKPTGARHRAEKRAS